MKYTLYHYSDKNIKDKIKPCFFGYNYFTKNDKKVSNITRSFFYTDNIIHEFRFKNSIYCYIAYIDKKDIYNISKDKKGYLKRFNGDINEALAEIKKHYNGIIYNIGYNVICLFYDIEYTKKTDIRKNKNLGINKDILKLYPNIES